MENRRGGSHLNRYRQIAEALSRHGLGYMVGIFGLEQFVPFHRGLFSHERREEPYTRPEHLRLALEDLGATFIKLGQILSTRPDLLPPDYVSELSKLQDAAPPVPGEEVRGLLVEELGLPPEKVFASFDPEPLAAASIGQAHVATLAAGTDVVVKVRRPGVVEQVEEDLMILQSLAARANRRWEVAERYDIVALAREFAETLRAELDYVREGRSAGRFAENFAGDEDVHIPQVYQETSTARVLTLERIRGIKVNDLAALDAAGIDRTELAGRAAGMVLDMIFEHGFFHADPHPGNFFVEEGGVLGIIDFGMVGTVDEATQEQLARLLVAITSQDADRLVDAFLELGFAKRRVRRDLLRQDLSRLLSRYNGLPLGEIPLGSLIEEALSIVRRHHLQFPPNLVLLLKMTIMSEGMGTQLDPGFNLTSALAPYAERLVMRRYSPSVVARRLKATGMEAAQLGLDLPEQLRRIAGDIERGDLEVGVRPEGFEPMFGRFERLANRIVLGIITAAFINGLAVLVSVYHPGGPGRWIGLMLAAGFATAAALGLYLAWSILRPGRRR
ncbi:ABC1 kinase family protein [Rubrobacter tropicus]|uniref:ABC1 kinase family protein n=1 Tax=Rubrobacter tropicus TaxID=2653851 RepID=UPI001A9DEAEA|nr:AarF/ABC1/UbiB kinase family protein [Rubrobacter tropicus]